MTSAPTTRHGSASLPQPTPSALSLLEQSRLCLAEAAASPRATQRHALAQLGALRAAAAVLATRARTGDTPAPPRRGRRSIWQLVAERVPELREWAEHFERSPRTSGVSDGGVSTRQADDLLRDADAFLAQVSTVLGLPVRHAFAVTRAVVNG